jgi:hypothetical protein
VLNDLQLVAMAYTVIPPMVLDGGVGQVAELARLNVRNIPRP